MTVLRAGLAIGILSTAFLTGCQNKVADENKRLWQQNRELQSELTDTRAQLKSSPNPADMQRMQADLAARDAKIKELEDSLRQPSAGSGPGIEGIETSYDPSKGEMTVNLPGDVLFDSGKATLKESAKATLSKVAAAIKRDYPGKAVRVEGHTDSDPIVKTKNEWQDNLDLSLNRAAAVTRYLESQGVDPKSVATTGFGPSKPKGNKAQSRRVEIIVVVR